MEKLFVVVLALGFFFLSLLILVLFVPPCCAPAAAFAALGVQMMLLVGGLYLFIRCDLDRASARAALITGTEPGQGVDRNRLLERLVLLVFGNEEIQQSS